MKLEAWLATLRAAARPLDLVELRTGAARIAARAQSLTGNQVTFHVTPTATGVRISAYPPSPLAQRALDRAVAEQADAIAEAVGVQGRERLVSG